MTSPLQLLALPAFADNYHWLLHDGKDAIVVDPGDAAPVVVALHTLGLRLQAILVTHHHRDHIGGLATLRPHLQGPVLGPRHPDLPADTHWVDGGQVLHLLGQRVEVLAVPGHTLSHLAFWWPDAQTATHTEGLLFCGDTLFSAGCGRLFEGTPAQMHASLSRLAALPDGTAVCCAHEYTLSNLRFAQQVEPLNTDVLAHLTHCEALRAQGLPTLPSTMARERAINPFLRCEVPEVRQNALRWQNRGFDERAHPDLRPSQDLPPNGHAMPSAADVLGLLREWKNAC